MRGILALIFVFVHPFFVYSQVGDTTSKPPFSSWTLRFNPLSFVEPVGGIQMGVETNIGKTGKFFLVSEYGFIFINNYGQYNDSRNNVSKNTGKISGWETKQEIKIALNTKSNIASFFAIELNYLNAGINNSGWFGMGKKDATGSYPYFKYQEFRETSNEVSMALKYATRNFSDTKKFNLEGFAGVGLIYRKNNYRKSEGVLIQADLEPLFDTDKNGINPYLAAGLRLLFKLK